jgi:hypothetical protein
LENGNGRHTIDVGASWPGGVIWGYPGNKADPVDGNKAKPQADLAEFTIGAGNLDFYDISNVVCPFELLPSKTSQFFQKIHNKHVHIYQSNWVPIFLLILPQIRT